MRRLVTVAAVAALVAGAVPARADEAAYLQRFDAAWHGGGKVLRNTESSPWSVNCDLGQSQGTNSINISGTCRAALVFSREIGARLRYDPKTGLYRGTYVGSKVGTATLTGKRRGDTLTLSIRWPKLVNGDTEATMTITNDGKGHLAIRVTDRAGKGGPRVVTSDLRFTAQ